MKDVLFPLLSVRTCKEMVSDALWSPTENFSFFISINVKAFKGQLSWFYELNLTKVRT